MSRGIGRCDFCYRPAVTVVQGRKRWWRKQRPSRRTCSGCLSRAAQDLRRWWA